MVHPTRLVALFLVLAGCRTAPPELDPRVRVDAFRALVSAGDYDGARRMMSADPRRWWEVYEGEGSPWVIGPHGRWADWDAHMRSRSEERTWVTNERSVTLCVSESNDYYRLLERGPQEVHYTYLLDSAGLIEGFLIAGVGERGLGRTDEYLAWAAAHEPDELEYLRPDGELDPTGDRAARTRAQIQRWRASAGLTPFGD